jgi:hypothetical protein
MDRVEAPGIRYPATRTQHQLINFSKLLLPSNKHPAPENCFSSSAYFPKKIHRRSGQISEQHVDVFTLVLVLVYGLGGGFGLGSRLGFAIVRSQPATGNFSTPFSLLNPFSFLFPQRYQIGKNPECPGHTSGQLPEPGISRIYEVSFAMAGYQ